MKVLTVIVLTASSALAAASSKKFDGPAFVRGVESIEIYSLHPSDLVVQDLHGNRAGQFRTAEHFHGFPVLGKIVALDREEHANLRKALAATLTPIREDRAPSMCFAPRHGVCLKKGEEHIDILLCFECEEARVILHSAEGSDTFGIAIRTDAHAILNIVLDRRNVRRDIPKKKQPNKAPEPTPTAVTPRAMEVKFEMKRWICNRIEARVVPAVGVAHL